MARIINCEQIEDLKATLEQRRTLHRYGQNKDMIRIINRYDAKELIRLLIKNDIRNIRKTIDIQGL